VALNLAEQCWRPEIEKNSGAVDSCLPSWWLHRRRLDGYRESRRCDGGVQVHGTRPEDGCRRWAYLPKPQSTGGTAVSHRSYPQAKSYYLAGLSSHRWRKSQRRWRESWRRSVVGGEHSTLASWSLAGYCTMAKPIQGAWQLKFRANFLSIFYGILPKDLHQSCRATNSFTSTIGSELSWALDQGWILVQRWLCYTVSVKFRVQSAWHPDFRLNYLQFLHNDLAYTLKQNCSPIIELQNWCGALRWILTDLKAIELQSWAYNTDFRLSQKSSNVALLQLSPKLRVQVANLHDCEPYNLKHLTLLVFTL
jgi:hypothetical protein